MLGIERAGCLLHYVETSFLIIYKLQGAIELETMIQTPRTGEKIKMYATTWCGDCRMARRWLDSRGIAYEYINIEENDDAAELVIQINKGARSVPTIVFPDGSVLVEPNARELAAKFSA